MTSCVDSPNLRRMEPQLDRNRVATQVITLRDNQFATLAAIENAVREGVPSIEVWGLSGTGKSVLESVLRPDSRFEIVDWAGARSGAGRVTLRFETGIPAWLGVREPSAGEIFHSPFPCRTEILESGRREQLHHPLTTLRPEDGFEDLARTLEQLGLGSATLFASLTKVADSRPLADEIAAFVALACARSSHPDPSSALSYLMRLAIPATDFSAEMRTSLIAEVTDALEKMTREGPSFGTFSSRATVPALTAHNLGAVIFGASPLSEPARETISWYTALPREVLTIDETCFVVRSRRPISDEETRLVCEILLPAQGALELRPWQLWQQGHIVVIYGSAPRKTGLYIYRGGEKEIYDGWLHLQPERDLTPLISESQDSRAALHEIYLRHGSVIPDGTLVYAGGDHRIHRQHVALAMAVELVLQRLGIPYEASRGDFGLPGCSVDFDGRELRSPGVLFKPRP